MVAGERIELLLHRLVYIARYLFIWLAENGYGYHHVLREMEYIKVMYSTASYFYHGIITDSDEVTKVMKGYAKTVFP